MRLVLSNAQMFLNHLEALEDWILFKNISEIKATIFKRRKNSKASENRALLLVRKKLAEV